MKQETFLKRFKSAKQRKQTNWEQLYREAMELYCPNREAFHKPVSGERKGRQVYSSMPQIAMDKASNNLQSSLTPHMKRWVELKPGRVIPDEEKDEAGDALREITRVLFDHIFASNFDIAISEFYTDLLIGTGALLVHSTPEEPLIFTAVPLHELYITTGALGTVDTVFREYKVKVGAIKSTWDDVVLGKTIEEMIESDPEKEIEIVEGTVPKKIMSFNSATNQEEEVNGFGYYVCAKKYQDNFLVERDMPVSPWIVTRWSVLSGEEWGRGPAIIALNDAKTLNQFIKLHMQSMELTVHPMYTVVDDGVINISAIRIKPGAMLPVSANDGVFGASIAPLRSGGNLQASQIEMTRLEASINDQMYTEAIGSVHLPVKTATEISIRQSEMAKRIGSAYGRMQYELIKPFINICLYFLDMNGLVNMSGYKVDGHNIAVDAVSPLSQGQAQEDVEKVTQYVNFAMSAFGPEMALTLLKPDQIMNFIADKWNLDSDLQVSQEEKQQMMQMMGQLQANQPAEGVMNEQNV